jgi:hypothetical protein
MAIGHDFVGSGSVVSFTERWNGADWTLQSHPTTGYQLWDISCTAANSCTAVGYHRTRRFLFFAGPYAAFAADWNGTVWSKKTLPHLKHSKDTTLFGVACISATACTAVGWTQLNAYTYLPVVEAMSPLAQK